MAICSFLPQGILMSPVMVTLQNSVYPECEALDIAKRCHLSQLTVIITAR